MVQLEYRSREDDGMAAIWFRNDEDGFRDWCEAHSDGFFVNANYKPRRRYLVLHKVGCPSFKTGGNFTGPHYVKLCADSIDDLRSALRRETDMEDFSQICKTCCPPTSV